MNIDCPFCEYKFSENINLYSEACISHKCKEYIISLSIEKDKIKYLGVFKLSDKSTVTVLDGQAIVDNKKNYFLGNSIKDFKEIVNKAINFKENLIFL